jgi:hypothetical protein
VATPQIETELGQLNLGFVQKTSGFVSLSGPDHLLVKIKGPVFGAAGQTTAVMAGELGREG